MKRRSREFWERLVTEAESGGRTRAEVAQRHGVSLGTLQGWVYRLRRERCGVDEATPSGPMRLIPVKVTHRQSPAAFSLQLQVGPELGLHFEAGTDVDYIAALVTALGGRR
jgi:transposase-like protein